VIFGAPPASRGAGSASDGLSLLGSSGATCACPTACQPTSSSSSGRTRRSTACSRLWTTTRGACSYKSGAAPPRCWRALYRTPPKGHEWQNTCALSLPATPRGMAARRLSIVLLMSVLFAPGPASGEDRANWVAITEPQSDGARARLPACRSWSVLTPGWLLPASLRATAQWACAMRETSSAEMPWLRAHFPAVRRTRRQTSR